MQGHTDIPLNAEGREQALGLQLYFQKNPVELILTSDLARAQETANIANSVLNRPVLVSSGLREVFLGKLEGMTLEEVHDHFGIEAWHKWNSIDKENMDFRFPEAESPREAVHRFEQTLRRFCQEHAFKSAAVSTHGFIMRRFLHHLRPDLKEMLPTPNCVVYSVQWNEETSEFSFLV